MTAAAHLQKQLKEITAHPLGGFRIEVTDDLFRWTVWFAGPKDTPYYPGQYKASLTFPSDFPFKPPTFKILSSFWHPNVYPDGNVCISILHPPGEDEHNTIETAAMRWTPIQSIEKVLLSVVSLLSDPDSQDAGAPANVDALVQFRKDKTGYNNKCKEMADKSLNELPADFEFPSEQDAPPQKMATHGSSMYGDVYTYEDDAYGGEDDGAEAESAMMDADASSPSKAHRFNDELNQIRTMGMGEGKTDDQILALLDKYKGDTGEVIMMLC